jgi:adenosylhomocysteine nucleosidase
MSADRPVRALVLTAIPEELAAFAARTLPPDVVAAATGEGPRNAARTAAELCARYRPRIVVGAGVAGGLTPDLGVGDLVVARRVLDDGGETPAPDAGLAGRAAVRPGARGGSFVSVDRPVVTAAGKAALAGRVAPSAAVVDMESGAWARAAAAAGIPFLIVRVVSDAADEELPGYLSRCVDEEGGIRRSAVALQALAHPGSIPALLRMRKRVAACSALLADFVVRFLAEGV